MTTFYVLHTVWSTESRACKIMSYSINFRWEYSAVTTQRSLEYWDNLVEWWVIPSMVRSYAIILPELIYGSVEYKVPMTLLLFDWKRPWDVGLMASVWLHQVTKPKELCNLQHNAIATQAPSVWWILEMEPSVKREELENGLACYRFSTDTQRKGKETCWTTSGLYLHQPPLTNRFGRLRKTL